MQYYEVLVGDSQFHGSSALTYSWHEVLRPGTVVRVSLRDRSALGFVVRNVKKPTFSTKSIAAIASPFELPPEIVKLALWMQTYYPSTLGTIIRQFLPTSIAFPKKQSVDREPFIDNLLTPSLPHLTNAQKEVIGSIKTHGSYLLHGITGSGKTRIYIELARQTLTLGRSVILLTPEIGLTEHLVQSVSVLPYRRFVLHSRLTTAARRDIWYKILESNEPSIIIGARSALFSPLKNIGLIILDESHDQAYKNDNTPRYRTERVASVLARFHKGIFLSGSATPNIEDVYTFATKKLPIITLDSLAKTTKLPVTTHIVDMRDRSNLGRSKIITNTLLNAMNEAFDRKEQSLLFLNRRGTANAILCESCGWRAMCEHCDLPLTYHGDAHMLRCHVCGRSQPLPGSCPECNQTNIILKTIGTKALVEEIERLFPTAHVKRFDTDVAKPEQIENQLQSLQDGSIDIIVGTQMIGKGLDLPRLSVVGIVNADASLLLPDYSANERTYQLLAQVTGRVGRGHRAGTIIAQTYNPEHPIIQAAVHGNWDTFYRQELEERRLYDFPPFCHLLKLYCLRATSKSAEKAAQQLASNIATKHHRVTIEGPATAFHPKESGKYKWQIVLKAPSRTTLLEVIQSLPSGWHYDIDPINLL